VINDSEHVLDAAIELELIRSGSVRVALGKTRLEVPGRGAIELAGSTLFEHFMDLTHAYRFGPRQYDVAIVRLRDAQSRLVSESAYFPGGLSSERADDLGLEAVAERVSDDAWLLRLQCQRFAQAVALDVPEFTTEDSYFLLAPGCERTVQLRATVVGAEPRGFVRPLNAKHATRITVRAKEASQS
jgi:beta-mannosidase